MELNLIFKRETFLYSTCVETNAGQGTSPRRGNTVCQDLWRKLFHPLKKSAFQLSARSLARSLHATWWMFHQQIDSGAGIVCLHKSLAVRVCPGRRVVHHSKSSRWRAGKVWGAARGTGGLMILYRHKFLECFLVNLLFRICKALKWRQFNSWIIMSAFWPTKNS